MDQSTIRWQSRMAPAMATAVVLSALFFASVAIWKVGSIEAEIRARVVAEPAIEWTRPGLEPSSFAEKLQLADTQARYALEREIIARRYHQGILAHTSRLWTRFMGFITGMILALVGAAFILGKLETDRSELGAATVGTSLTLRSTSPGIVLAALGTGLMAISIAVNASFETRDMAIYLSRAAPMQIDRFEEAGQDDISAADPNLSPEPPLAKNGSQ